MTAPGTELCLLDIDHGVAVLTWNRPDRNNGMTAELQARYTERLAECEANPDVKAIVVTGAGRSFCPGADMNDLAAGASGAPRGAGGLADTSPPAAAARPSLPAHYAAIVGKPVIGAINGACAGLGLVHALYMDVRFAARGVKFTCAFSQRGLIAEYGVAWLLPRLCGQARALDLLMSSRVIQADEAERLGLVNFVVEPDQLLEAAKSYAYDLATKCSPVSMAVMKRQVFGDYEVDLATSVERAHALMVRSLRREDFREGVSSYLEKRAPHFQPYTGAEDPLA